MKKLVALAVLLVLAVAVLVVPSITTPNRTVVRNLSGRTFRDLSLVVTRYEGTRVYSADAETLRPDGSLELRHDLNDSRVLLRYTIDGVKKEHVEPYVDLWTGQTWVIQVLPDDRVRSSYASVLDPSPG